LYSLFKALNKIDQSLSLTWNVLGMEKSKNNITFSKKELSKQLEATYSQSTTTKILRLYKSEPPK